ncbi:TauD/TfdA family dioxygenase [Actibacterium sp. D379-3]
MTTQAAETIAEMPVTPLKAGAIIDASAVSDPAEIDVQAVLDAYHTYGAVLIEGADITREGFVAVTERFLDSFMEYVGGADNDRGSALGKSSTVLTVTGGNTEKQAIPLHGEMFYTEPRPQTLFFCCMRPAAENGETTICDGVALWDALPEDARNLFLDKRLVYRRIYTDDAWTKVYKTDDIERVAKLCEETGVTLTRHPDGSIETVHVADAFVDHKAGRSFINSILTWAAREYLAGIKDSQLRFEDGTELPKEMLYKINEIAETLTVNVPWKPGTLAIVDNTRVMHGRRAYEDSNRDIIMRLSLESLPETAEVKH